MKRLKYILIFCMILCLALGLWFSGNKEEKFVKTEFIMDTTCSVTFYGENGENAAKEVFEEIRRIDSLMNLYNDSSEISRINKAESNKKIKVSKDTYFVLETALEICKQSGGAFDITIAPLSKLWNSGRDENKIPAKEEIFEALLKVGYQNIVLENGDTVYKKTDETEIDLGAAAKGYAGDRALEIARKYKLTGGIIDLGGNILCFGENPNSKNGKWKVGIQTPFAQTGTYKKTVEVKDKTIVTSGIYQRYFEKDGEIYHHILDPSTGYPAKQKYRSVTVVADSSLKADCIATAIYITGERKIADKHNGEVYFE